MSESMWPDPLLAKVNRELAAIRQQFPLWDVDKNGKLNDKEIARSDLDRQIANLPNLARFHQYAYQWYYTGRGQD